MSGFEQDPDIEIRCEPSGTDDSGTHDDNGEADNFEIVPADSVILRKASPVFAAMLSHDMQETTTKQIEVHKTKEEWMMFYAFLHPATGRSCKVEHGTVDMLLPIFDEYQMNLLVDECEALLLAMPPSVDRLLQAERYGLSKQYNRCLVRVAASMKELKTAEIEMLSKEQKIMAGLLPVIGQQIKAMTQKKNVEISKVAGEVYQAIPAQAGHGVASKCMALVRKMLET